jgi:dihydrofolate reductase
MSHSKVHIVVAMAQNRAIGKDNQLLWHLPNDLRHFKQLTSGHTVIMGRKTFESIGKPLPNRRNIVITRQNHLQAEGVEIVHSLEDALTISDPNEEVFVIGGAEIYQLALKYCSKITLTLVDCLPDADAYFPDIDFDTWDLTEQHSFEKDERHGYAYQFLTYVRHDLLQNPLQ